MPLNSHSLIDEAVRWAVRMESGGFDAKDRERFRVWLEKDPAHRTTFARCQHLLTDLSIAVPVLVDKHRLEFPTVHHAPKKTHHRSSWLLVGAAAAIMGTLILSLPPAPASKAELFSTRGAELKNIVLSDGSSANLNARTRIQAVMGTHERRIRLECGEAMFSVTKNPERPFLVETARGVIRVTGTVFDVRTDARGGVTVLVLEGNVEFSPKIGDRAAEAPLDLSRGDIVSETPESRSVRHLADEDAAKLVGWKEGWVYFDGTTLAEAAKCFENFSGDKIVVDTDIATLQLGGGYRLADLGGFLDAVHAVLPVVAERSAGGETRLRRSQAK